MRAFPLAVRTAGATAVLATALAVGLAGSGLLPAGSGEAAAPDAQTSAAAGPPAPVAQPPTERGIAFFADRVAARPDDAVSWATLGQLYHQLGRETGADRPFVAAERALRSALELVPDYTGARAALATTLVSRHRFTDASGLAGEVLTIDPTDTAALATRGDAHLATGRVTDAARDYDALARLEPGAESLARLAHVREVRGDPEAAITLMEDAVDDIGTETGERAAWMQYRLGDLHRHLGHWDDADAAFESSLTRLADFPLALSGLADVAVKTGDLDGAEALLDRLEVNAPRPDAWLARADLATLRGHPDQAEALVQKAIDFFGARNLVLAGRDLATVLADNNLQPDAAVAYAAADLERRPDVFAHDTHAWALYRAGRIDEARAAADRALRLGTAEPGFFFHSALIAEAEGDADRARHDLEKALAINPDFDALDARAATALLADLDSR